MNLTELTLQSELKLLLCKVRAMQLKRTEQHWHCSVFSSVQFSSVTLYVPLIVSRTIWRVCSSFLFIECWLMQLCSAVARGCHSHIITLMLSIPNPETLTLNLGYDCAWALGIAG